MIALPRVSVIVPFWNAGPFLREAIDSVFNQTFAEWELLLVDDGSTDESSDTARVAAARYSDRVRYFDHPHHANRGPAATRNLALSHARGEYIALLDADDVWLPHKLERQVAILDGAPALGMVCGRAQYWREWTGRKRDIGRDSIVDIGVAGDTVYQPPRLATLLYPLGRGGAPCPSDILARRDVVLRLGGFVEEFSGTYRMYEDQAFLIKIYFEAPVFVANECWIKYRLHETSLSSRTLRAGHYHEIRGFFLTWLSDYIRSRQLANADIEAALQRAFWLQDHPHFAKMLYLVQRVRGGLANSSTNSPLLQPKR